MHRSNGDDAPPPPPPPARQRTGPIGVMYPPTATSTGNQVPAGMAPKRTDCPHFSYESLSAYRCSQSPNSCTRLLRSAGARKSRALQGVVRKSSLKRPAAGDTRSRPAVRGDSHTPSLPPPAADHHRLPPLRDEHHQVQESGPGTQVIHVPEYRNRNTISANALTRSRENSTPERTRPNPKIRPIQLWKQPRLPSAMSFRFPYRAATGKLAWSDCTLPFPPLGPTALLLPLPIGHQRHPGRSTPPGCARREGPLPGSNAALLSAGPPSPSTARPRRYRRSLRLCRKFTSRSIPSWPPPVPA